MSGSMSAYKDLGVVGSPILERPGALPNGMKKDRELLLANATLTEKHQELATAYADLDGELRKVGLLQRSLLPSSLPAIATLSLAADYQTSARAGGDYYDLFELSNNRWGILIADVSGHGTPAAVIMAITHALAHAYVRRTDSPAALLDNLNSTLTRRYTADGSFITAFYGVFEADTRTLCYATAGHPAPRLVRCDNISKAVTIRELPSTHGLPLGVLSNGIAHRAYRSITVNLLPGDALLLYTDGVTEARSQNGDFFGPEGLDRVLGMIKWGCDANGLIRAVNKALGEFTSDAPLSDDRTLVAACVL